MSWTTFPCQLHKESVGTDKIQARVVTDMEESHLWETGIPGTHSPMALQNTFCFYRGWGISSLASQTHPRGRVWLHSIEQLVSK